MKIRENKNRRVIRTYLESAAKMPKKLRVAFYIRVSRKNEDQMHSFEAQREACELTLRQHPEYELVRLYADPGISGTLAGKRPGFMDMIADAEAGRIDLIITKSISRWSRNTIECLTYVNELKNRGIDVIFEKEGIDTREVYSVLALHIFAVLSQEESRSISENTKVGIRWGFEMGEARWCPIYGYTRGKSEYEIVPHEQAVIREIFSRYEQGESITEIVNTLNGRGVPAARGGKWRSCRVHGLLTNRKYIGELVMQRYYTKDHISHSAARNDGSVLPIYTVPEHHAPIVSQEQFERVQRILSMRYMGGGRANQYPFGDLLRCPLCGENLRQRAFSRGRRSARIWHCEGCERFAMKSETIERAVLQSYASLDAGSVLRSWADFSSEQMEAARTLASMKREHEQMEKVEYLLLDKLVERLELGQHETPSDSVILIHWRVGHTSVVKTEADSESPGALAAWVRLHRANPKPGEQLALA